MSARWELRILNQIKITIFIADKTPVDNDNPLEFGVFKMKVFTNKILY